MAAAAAAAAWQPLMVAIFVVTSAVVSSSSSPSRHHSPILPVSSIPPPSVFTLVDSLTAASRQHRSHSKRLLHRFQRDCTTRSFLRSAQRYFVAHLPSGATKNKAYLLPSKPSSLRLSIHSDLHSSTSYSTLIASRASPSSSPHPRAPHPHTCSVSDFATSSAVDFALQSASRHRSVGKASAPTCLRLLSPTLISAPIRPPLPKKNCVSQHAVRFAYSLSPLDRLARLT